MARLLLRALAALLLLAAAAVADDGSCPAWLLLLLHFYGGCEFCAAREPVDSAAGLQLLARARAVLLFY